MGKRREALEKRRVSAFVTRMVRTLSLQLPDRPGVYQTGGGGGKEPNQIIWSAILGNDRGEIVSETIYHMMVMAGRRQQTRTQVKSGGLD